MADLEKMLLEAAGRSANRGRNRRSSPPSRRRKKGSYTDDDRAYSKPSSSHVPPKKRKDNDRSIQGHDEDDDVHNHHSDNDSVGSDLYKGEDDRKKLSKMTELEREMVLEDRATKRSDRDMTKKLKKSKVQDRKVSPHRPQTRSMRLKSQRANALNELVKRRRDAAKGRYLKRRSYASARSTSPSSSENGSHSEEESRREVDRDDEKVTSKTKLPTYEDLREITIRRSKLAKWFMEPFFDELIVGCFVRVGIARSPSGPIYRLCVVRNVDCSDADRQYMFDNKTTHKYLNVVWGDENSAALWQMAMVSDSPPLKEEFDQWVREVERSGGQIPTKQEVREKKEAIKKTNSYVYNAETVKQMLQEKKSATWRPINVALEKDRLRSAMEVARENGDEAEMARIKAKIQELEATRQGQGVDAKAIRLAEMNRKNRAENFKNASQLKPVNRGLKAGEAGYDPFSRRWTRSTNYYAANTNEGNITSVDDDSPLPKIGGVAATEAALVAAAGAGKLVDTNAPVDEGIISNFLHNFDLPISLAVLDKFGGPHGARDGFMARKGFVEMNAGLKVKPPMSDGGGQALTLTVNDYKRRRGLL